MYLRWSSMDQGGGIGNGEKIDEGDQWDRYLGVNSHRTWWISCGRVVGGNIMVPVFPMFLWSFGVFLGLVYFSTELFVHAYHLYSLSGEGRNSDPLPGCILHLPCVFWVCGQVRDGLCSLYFCLRVWEQSEPALSVPYWALPGHLEWEVRNVHLFHVNCQMGPWILELQWYWGP